MFNIKSLLLKSMVIFFKDPCENVEADPSEAKLRKLSYKIYKAWKSELERKVELQRNKVTVQSDKVSS